jgi:sugar phosphate isomerase/epimerase
MKTISIADSIGISTNIFKNPIQIFPLLEKLGNNFHTVEIELENTLKEVFDYDNSQKAIFFNKIAQIKAEKKLNFSVHGPYLGCTTDIAATDNDIRKNAVMTMKKALEVAYELDAKIFTCHPGYLDKAPEFKQQMMLNLDLSLEELSAYAERLGITIALENTGDYRPDYIVLDYTQHQRLCEKHGIGITLDLIHYTTFNPMDVNYFPDLKSLIPYVKNIHFADMKVPYHAHLPLGSGNFSYDEILKFIYQQGYQGKAIIEETSNRYAVNQYLEEAIAYQKKLNSSKKEVSSHV